MNVEDCLNILLMAAEDIKHSPITNPLIEKIAIYNEVTNLRLFVSTLIEFVPTL